MKLYGESKKEKDGRLYFEIDLWQTMKLFLVGYLAWAAIALAVVLVVIFVQLAFFPEQAATASRLVSTTP